MTGPAGVSGTTGQTGVTGSVGPTGPGAITGMIAIVSQTAAGTQTLAAATPTLIQWPTVDAAQTTGSSGLGYAAGLFMNNTTMALPILVEYAVFLNATGYGASYIAVNGPANAYATIYNDVNAFTNSYTIYLQPTQTIGIYYTDNGTPTIQASSRVTMTILSVGQAGPTGASPSALVATLSLTAAGQTIPAGGTGTLVQWGAIDATQTQSALGLSYTLPTGLLTNMTPAPLPLMVEYSVLLSTTSGGSSFIGISTAGVVTPYGPMMNDTNGFANSFTVLLPAGSGLGVYYMDNATTVVQTSTRLRVTLLMAAYGPTGQTGPMGQVATLAVTPTTVQSITATTTTLLLWGTTDATQSQNLAALTYAAGQFTNTSAQTMALLVEYAVFLSTTGAGTSAIGINGSTQTYGTMFNDNNAFTNSYTILLPPASSFGVYYYDNNAVQVQTMSRLMITQLVAGPQGPTGPSMWGQTGTTAWTNNAVIIGTGTAPTSLTLNGTLNGLSVGQGGGGVVTNTVLGTNALANNTVGANILAIGYNAGYTPAGATGSNNIYVGAQAVPSSGAATNEIVIGQGATGLGSNTVSIGSLSTQSTTIVAGSVRSFTVSVMVSATGYAQVIANATAGNPLYAASGVWQITANATAITNPASIPLAATAHVATNVAITSYAAVMAAFSSSVALAITGGTNTGATTGYGVFLNVTSSVAYGTYTVNFLRLV